MKKLLLVLAIITLFFGFAVADDTTKTLTFEWTQTDTVNLKEWKLLWSDTSGGEFVEVATIPYDSEVLGPVYTGSETINVTGKQGTYVLKYFILRACGDIPMKEGTEYICSENSNEVSYNFWIPAGVFSVPINFTIKVE